MVQWSDKETSVRHCIDPSWLFYTSQDVISGFFFPSSAVLDSVLSICFFCYRLETDDVRKQRTQRERITRILHRQWNPWFSTWGVSLTPRWVREIGRPLDFLVVSTWGKGHAIVTICHLCPHQKTRRHKNKLLHECRPQRSSLNSGVLLCDRFVEASHEECGWAGFLSFFNRNQTELFNVWHLLWFFFFVLLKFGVFFFGYEQLFLILFCR